MSIDLFRTTHGIDIQSDDLSSNAYILQGVGIPGNRAIENEAPQGSIYMRVDDTTDGSTPVDSSLNKLQLYWKHAAGSGADKWSVGASKEFVENAVTGISWREPVRVLETTNYADITAVETELNDTGTPGNVGGVDSDQFADGDRILIADLTSGNTNVYVVTGTPGSGATLTEDSNAATDGDAVLINEGDHADQQWIFDGLSWIHFGSAGSAQELQYIRNFIGKSSPGVELPDYLSEDLITDGDPLDVGLSKIDDAIGDLQFTENNILTNFTRVVGSPDYNSVEDITKDLDLLDQLAGDGEITNDGGNYALTDDMFWGSAGTLDLTDALDQLNEAIGDRSYTNDFIVTDGQTIASSIDALDSVIGDIDNSSAWTSGGFLSTTTLAGNTIQETLDDFNQEIQNIVDDTEENTGGPVPTSPTATVIDTIATTDATNIKWLLQVKDGSGNRRSMEIHALTDGSTVDWNRFSILRIGSTGSVGVNVAINTGNIELSISPASALTYTVKRISKSYLA